MKKSPPRFSKSQGSKTLPAIAYLLLVALTTMMAGSSFRPEFGLFLVPFAAVSLLLLTGIAGKKVLHFRKGRSNNDLATTASFPG